MSEEDGDLIEPPTIIHVKCRYSYGGSYPLNVSDWQYRGLPAETGSPNETVREMTDDQGKEWLFYQMKGKGKGNLISKSSKKESNAKSKQVENIQLHPTTPTTSSYNLRSWGGYDRENKVLIEQVTPNLFIYNRLGIIGLAEVQLEVAKKKKPHYYLDIPFPDGTTLTYTLPRVLKVGDFYEPISLKTAHALNDGTYQAPNLKDILAQYQNTISILYDFQSPSDVGLWQLHILQSWLKPLLEEFFFIGVDATKGGGKTTLLENQAYLCRHGWVGGDVSAASIPRLVEEHDLDLFLDEIDQRVQKNGEEDSVGVLRKGQRRGNPYVRVNGKTMMVEKFDVAGGHAFSYRSDVEDAFQSRSFSVHTAPSKDNRLPVLNIYKRQVLAPLREKLWAWYILNFHELATKSEHILHEVTNLLCSDALGSIEDGRRTLYDVVTQELTISEKELLNHLENRNKELGFLLIRITRITGLDMATQIKFFMKAKVEDDATAESIHLDLLREVLAERLQCISDVGTAWQLLTGNNEGLYYYPKSKVYTEFCTRLADQKLATISTRRYNSLLRDLGFQAGTNITSQRPKTPEKAAPTACLVFDNNVKSKILGSTVVSVEGCSNNSGTSPIEQQVDWVRPL